MDNISKLNATIALGGYGTGLVLGCLNNVRKTGSLFKKHYAPKNASKISFVFECLKVSRHERATQQFSKASEFLKPKIWNPFMPLEHLLPLSLFIITQLCIDILFSKPNIATTATLITNYTFRVIVLPIVLHITVLLGGHYLLTQFDPYARKMGIDPSGYALIQSAAAVYKFFVFSSLSSLNLSSNVYRTMAAVTTLSDYLWTYETTTSYHSVMDVAIPTIFMGISFGAVYAGTRAFITYAPEMLRLLNC